MPERSASSPPEASERRQVPQAQRYEPPAFEVIGLDCEITAYAPAGDEPLF